MTQEEIYYRLKAGLEVPQEEINRYANSVDNLNRHKGVISDSNPYKDQLNVSTNKQDIDALYEGAIDYEVKKAVLDEQREYDLPVNKVIRDRQAGINSDLAGASGSGASSSGSSAQMQGLERNTPFSNSYDNTNLVLGGINAAVSGITGFTSAYTSIVGALDTLATQDSRIALNDATAKLNTAQANEIDGLLEGRKKGLNLSNAGKLIDNSNAVLGHLASLSQLLSADSDDASIISSIKGLGLSTDEGTLNSYKDIVKAFHKNPAVQEKFFSDSLGSRIAEEEYDQYDETTVASMVSFEKRSARAQRAWDANYNELQARVAEMLNNKDYATGMADLEQSVVGNANVAADIQGQLLEADYNSLALKLEEITKAADDCQAEIDEIEKNPQGKPSRDKFGNVIPGKRELTSFQKQRIRALKLQKGRLLASGSEKYEQCFDLIEEINRQTATFNAYNSLGVPVRPEAGLGAYNQEEFMSIYTRRASVGEVVREQLGHAITAAGIFFAGRAAKGTTVVNTTTTSVPTLYGADNKPVVIDQRTLKYGDK